MDQQAAVLVAVQVSALAAIAVFLVLYLMFRMATCRRPAAGRPILITAGDTALGCELAAHLARVGFKVFAGVRDPAGPQAQRLRAHLKHMEAQSMDGQAVPEGSIVMVTLDPAREDLLREALDLVRKSLPAGYDGLWAVVNTAGLCCRGRLDQQDHGLWEALYRHNVLAALRASRAFLPLLKHKHGRLLSVGAWRPDSGSSGLVAFAACRSAVQGANEALRQELVQSGVDVVILRPDGLAPERVFGPPQPPQPQSEEGTFLQMETSAPAPLMPGQVVHTVEHALLSKRPREYYDLLAQTRREYCRRWLAGILRNKRSKP